MYAIICLRHSFKFAIDCPLSLNIDNSLRTQELWVIQNHMEKHGLKWTKPGYGHPFTKEHHFDQRFPMWCKIAKRTLCNEFYVDLNSVKIPRMQVRSLLDTKYTLENRITEMKTKLSTVEKELEEKSQVLTCSNLKS